MKKEVLSSDNVHEIQAISEALKSDNNQKQKTTMKCPKCGAEMVLASNPSASNPSMYELRCQRCGATKYELVHQIYTPGFENEPGKIMYLPDPWQEFRANAAKDFVSAILMNPSTGLVRSNYVVASAIECADDLIKQLKERDEHNNSK